MAGAVRGYQTVFATAHKPYLTSEEWPVAAPPDRSPLMTPSGGGRETLLRNGGKDSLLIGVGLGNRVGRLGGVLAYPSEGFLWGWVGILDFQDRPEVGKGVETT